MKDKLYWNNSSSKLRIAQGVPQKIPKLPSNELVSASEILELTTETIFHVSNLSGDKELVYLYVSSPVECTVYVRVVPPELLSENDTRTRISKWPSTVDAMSFKIRSLQPSPIPVLQGYQISNGAAISLMSTVSDSTAFGFTMKNF